MKSNQLHWALYFLFLLACARQTSPTGGPKDTIPPILVKSHPRNQQTNFKGNEIRLAFSEPIQVNNPKEQLIITPSIGKDFEVKAKKQEVILTWSATLNDSTTYTFNFRDAVADITEKNPARKLRIAVSTGSYIDSLSIEGHITNFLDESFVKDALVALQPYADTFNIFKHTPAYFTKTDDKGSYKLENLKPGTYQLYSFIDQNRNLVVDSKNERYGFKKDSLLLLTPLKKQDIGLLKLDARNLTVTAARPYNSYFNIRTSKGIKSATLTAADSTYLNYTFGADASNVVLYNTFNEIDSLLINLSINDSIENRFDTTLYAKFSKQKVTLEKFSSNLTKTSLLADEGTLQATLTFSKPISEINFDSIYFQIDSLTKISFNKENVTYEPMHKTLKISTNIDKALYKKDETIPGEEPKAVQAKKIKKLNTLHFGKGAFISVEQDSSTSTAKKLNPLYFEDLGMIIVELQPAKEKTIIQLLNSKKEIVADKIHSTKATFANLEPGDYLLRLIIDRNGNGAWDAGSYLKHKEPERMIYYQNEKGTKEIKLKANFELGPLLITY
jgi:uncharacterized protein (DUF2141 family)